MVPKHNSSDADNASNPKRSRDVLSNAKRMKILDTIEIGRKKNCMQRLPGCIARTNLPFMK